MLKAGARQKFETAQALEYYKIYKNYKLAAAALSVDLKCEISDEGIRARFKREGINVDARPGRQIKPDSMTSSERSRKCRERKAPQALSLVESDQENANSTLPRSVPRVGRKPDLTLDVMAAYELYKGSGSLKEVALKFGFSLQTISTRFKAAGLEVRPKGRPLEFGELPVPGNIRQQKYYQRKKNCG